MDRVRARAQSSVLTLVLFALVPLSTRLVAQQVEADATAERVETKPTVSAEGTGAPPAGERTDLSEASPVRASGLRAFVDPDTGLLRRPTAEEEAAFARAFGQALDYSHEGLFEELGEIDGFKVDLQRRFRMTLYATVDPGGNVSIDHHPEPQSAPTIEDGSGPDADNAQAKEAKHGR